MRSSLQAIKATGALPGENLRRVRHYDWNTTPGKLRIARVAIVLGIMVAGIVGVVAASSRIQTMRDIDNHLEPLNANVTVLYRALADADTTVAVGFLSGRVEARQIRARYDGDVELAAASLAQAEHQAGGERVTADQMSDIAKQLPVYTGLVERARASNRQGLTVGVAYLRLASDLMQGRILPQAAELQRRQATQLDDAYEGAGSVQVVALVACGISLAGLVWAQIFLFRRTHRVFNLGLITASAAVLTGLVWWTVTEAASATPLANSHRHSQSTTEALGPAEIAALQARTVESLGLARTGTTTEQDFDARMQRLNGALDAARGLVTDQIGRDLVDMAADKASSYASAHKNVQELDQSAQSDKAVEAAMSTKETSAASAFDQLDKALLKAIDYRSQAFEKDIRRAQNSLTDLPIASGMLALAAAVGAALGIQRRLEEYR